MNSSIKYTPQSLHDHRAFIEHLLSIIDTKLQYVEYHTSVLINEHSAAQYPVSIEGQRPPSSINEQVFAQIEQYSKTTRLLLLLRTHVCGNNSSLVYDLLTNNKFLDYFDEQLKALLEQSLA